MKFERLAIPLIILIFTLSISSLAYLATTLKNPGHTYTVGIKTELMDYKVIAPVIKALNEAKSGDIVIIEIDSLGGRVSLMNQVINAMYLTKAKTVTKVIGQAQSAAAYIASKSDRLIVGPYSILMFHFSTILDLDCSQALGQRAGVDNVKHCESSKKAEIKNFNNVVDSTKLLTAEEKVLVKEGQDVYITGAELINRGVAHDSGI